MSRHTRELAWRAELDARTAQGLRRRQQENRFASQQVINFSSNDYLGLSQADAVKNAFQEGVNQYGAGSGASPLVTGFYPAHQKLVSQLCDWLNKPCALLFSSGFSANQALLFTLLQREDVVLQDKLNHASLLEAGQLSPATQWRFRHNDMRDLEKRLQRHMPLLTITEGVFSMDGDKAPLTEMAQLCADADSMLMVDDAHAIGVLGEQGEGSAAEITPDITLVTFGKALGVHGAAILCDELVYDYLLQYARHYTYSTAMPPAQAMAVSAAIECAQTEHWRREKLQALSACFYETLDSTIHAPITETAIKPVIIADTVQCLAVSEQLKGLGFHVSAIRPPTVPTSRLRITLTASHTAQQVIALCQALNRILS
ncbi:8-amino-7-oxononanoate synthase [Thaumasiovibrio subtropicus]|uniref:8-amino-7-oxononanoate synthase n=1 Tax=Thaumasiovibrio subtropicus TaxID=1891207 RepID=UPI000B3626AC|nr:8-amino-7-oxononanoate synthase [Thaumasiovibrio subtropicus]